MWLNRKHVCSISQCCVVDALITSCTPLAELLSQWVLETLHSHPCRGAIWDLVPFSTCSWGVPYISISKQMEWAGMETWLECRAAALSLDIRVPDIRLRKSRVWSVLTSCVCHEQGGASFVWSEYICCCYATASTSYLCKEQ